MRRQTAGEGNSQGILAGQGNSQVPFKLQCRTRALLHRLCHKHVVAWSRLFCYPETCMILIFPVIGFKLSQAHSLWQRSRTLSQLFTCRGTWSAAVHMAATVKGRERPAAFRRFSETRLPIGFTVCHWSGFFFFLMLLYLSPTTTCWTMETNDFLATLRMLHHLPRKRACRYKNSTLFCAKI